MKDILKLAFVLFLVCAITAGVLGGVYELTKETIDMQKNAATYEALQVVLYAPSYTELPFDSAAHPTVDKVYKANNDEGYVVLLTVSGAQGMITVAVGVDNDQKCTGISIIEHSETSGLGANAASASEIGVNFRAQFVGQDSGIALTNAGGSIEALSGATITSKALVDAVKSAIGVVAAVK